MTIRNLLALAVLPIAFACGGSQPPAEEPKAEEPAPAAEAAPADEAAAEAAPADAAPAAEEAPPAAAAE